MSSAAPLFAVDIGNSRIKIGLFADWTAPAAGQLPKCESVSAFESDSGRIPWDQLRALVPGAVPECIVASVNPPACERFLKEWSQTGWSEPSVVRDFTQLPIVNQTSPPQQTGIDRLLKGVAGNILRPAGQPLIVIDSGTATTVDWITPRGTFAGGAILPGLSLSSRALHDHTAQLPLIPAEDFDQVEPLAIGTNTHEALRSGLYWGHVGAVRELIDRITAANPELDQMVLITGGAGQILARALNLTASYRRDLTLQGLAVTASHLSGRRR